MRVTNSMITNNSVYHMSNAKKSLMKYNDQYTTQKKILRPSDDPTIAVRSLKFRTNVKYLTQYLEKNVPDARSWMNLTEGALDNISTILTDMNQYCNQGANDVLTAADRKDILVTLQQYVQSIYHQEASTDFNGRYIFTGYRTDTSLLFEGKTTNLTYNITENFKSADIDKFNYVTGGANYDPLITSGQDYVDDVAEMKSGYRLTLAYNNLSNSVMTVNSDGTVVQPTGVLEDYVMFDYSFKDGTTGSIPATTKSSNDPGAYDVADDEVVFLYDTGEIIMGKDVYNSVIGADISISYTKNDFTGEDIRPEHYFQCDSYNSVTERLIGYANPSGQDIKYDINFSQSIKVNTQACDAISTEIRRTYDYIYQTVDEVNATEAKIEEVKKLIASETDPATIATLGSLQKALEQEYDLRTKVMQEAFGKGIGMIQRTQQTISNAVSDLGARSSRLELTYNKLLDQKNEFEKMLSDNEDIDLGEAYVNLYEADLLYQASLNATSKILGNTLLNYIS